MGLEFVGRLVSGQRALDTGIQGLEIVTTGQGAFALSTSGTGGGLVSYALGATGPARIVDTQTFPSALSAAASQMVDALDVGGGHCQLVDGRRLG